MTLPSPLRRRLVFLLLSLAVVTPFIVAASQAAGAAKEGSKEAGKVEVEDDSIFKYLTVFTEVLGLVRSAYVEPTEPEVLMTSALDGTVDALDPFASFVPASAAQKFGEAARVGASRSGLRLARERGMVFVATVDEGGPAAKSGVAVGDILAKLDGASSRQMPFWEIEARFAAAEGTHVDSEWIRRGEMKKVDLVLASFAAAAPSLSESRGVPVLHLPQLTSATVAQVRELLAAQHPTRLVFDLRGTTGSDPRAAFDLGALFADGELGQLKVRDKSVETFTDTTPNLFAGEMVALVDRSTVGPAEVLAALLQQRAGARLVGERTFGYAGRQETVTLSDGSRLRLATGFYTGPDGKPISTGLSPDLSVDESTRRFGEKDEPLGELILRKGVGLLLGEEKLPEKKAA
ncbi:MAG: PDZ domain-containing protein [Holophagales bacterium]|nr:MAG: PDZ domain-containing protein [Holophagales bacterium]